MAQAWESDAIRAAGEKWAAAKAKGDTAGMQAAAAEANRLRAESGYNLDGGKANSDVTVNNQSTWRGSGAEKNYLAGVHGIGTPSKSMDPETYNMYYGPGGTYVDNLDQKVKDNASKQTPTPQSQTTQKNTVPAGAVVRTIYKADGTTAQGYIQNGKTYYTNGTPIQNGDAVIDDNGKKWVKGDTAQNAQAKAELDAQRAGVTGVSQVPVATVPQNSGLPTTYEELNLMLQNNYQKAADDMSSYYEKLLQQQQNQINYNTQVAIRDQQAQADQAALDAYDLQKQVAIQSAKTGDNIALASAAKGDAGGIGQKQYSDAANTYDKQVYEINLQLKNVEAQVAQNVADLKAQGQFELANAALEIGLAQIEALQKQRDELMSVQMNLAQKQMDYNTQQDQIAYDRALQRLQLGAFGADDAKALGISDADAERIAAQLNITAQIDLVEAQKQLAALKQSTAPKKIVEDENVTQSPVDPVAPGGTVPNATTTDATKSLALRNALLNELRGAGTLTQEELLGRIQRAQASGMSDEDAYALIVTLLGNTAANDIYSNYWAQTK